MIFLQDNITKITAKYLRENSTDLGLANEDIFIFENNHITTLTSDFRNARLFKGELKLKELNLTKRIGINPFAGVYISTITC